MTQLLKSTSPYWNDYWLWMMSMQFTQTVQALLCESRQHNSDNLLISYSENFADTVQSMLHSSMPHMQGCSLWMSDTVSVMCAIL